MSDKWERSAFGASESAEAPAFSWPPPKMVDTRRPLRINIRHSDDQPEWPRGGCVGSATAPQRISRRNPMNEQAPSLDRSPPAARPVIRLHPADNVVIARATLLPGAPAGDGVTAAQRIPPGHKIAVRPIGEGEPVLKYNQIIG